MNDALEVISVSHLTPEQDTVPLCSERVEMDELLSVRQTFLYGRVLAKLTGIEKPPIHADPSWFIQLIDEVLSSRGASV